MRVSNSPIRQHQISLRDTASYGILKNFNEFDEFGGFLELSHVFSHLEVLALHSIPGLPSIDDLSGVAVEQTWERICAHWASLDIQFLSATNMMQTVKLLGQHGCQSSDKKTSRIVDVLTSVFRNLRIAQHRALQSQWSQWISRSWSWTPLGPDESQSISTSIGLVTCRTARQRSESGAE